MEFLHTSTMEDCIDSDRVTRKTNPLCIFFGQILTCYVVPALEFLLSFKALSEEAYAASFTLIILAIFCILFFYFLYPGIIDKMRVKSMLSNVKLKENLTIPRKIILDEEHFIISTKDKVTKVKLEEIGGIVEYNDKIFIMTKWQLVLFVLPNNLFSSHLNKEDFIKMITSKVKSKKKYKNLSMEI